MLRTLAGGAVALALAATGARADGQADSIPPPPADGAAPGTSPPPEPAQAPVVHDEVIGILDVRVDGLSATASDVLTRGVAAAVGQAGYMVVLPDRLREVMTTTPFNSACRVGPCLIELHRQADVGMVLVAGIVAIGVNHDYVVTLIDTVTGLPIGQIQRTCDVCTTEEAIKGMAAASIELVVLSAGRAPDPIVEPPPSPPPDHGPALRRASMRRTGLLALGAAAIATGGGLLLHEQERRDLGAGFIGARAALAVVGGTLLVMSFDF